MFSLYSLKRVEERLRLSYIVFPPLLDKERGNTGGEVDNNLKNLPMR
jgi:hypothetical protein